MIQNNQVGFTTDPRKLARPPTRPTWRRASTSRSSTSTPTTSRPARRRSDWRWPTASAGGLVIDLIGYRRYGHNETDEPAYTQPRWRPQIKNHPPVSEIYAKKLIEEGVVTRRGGRARRQGAPRRDVAALKDLRTKMEAGEYEDPTYHRGDRRARPHREPAGRHGGPGEKLRAAERGADQAPESFTVHRKLRKPLAAARDARRGRDRIRPRRGARLRVAAHRGHTHPAHRPGHRARHLLQPPPRPPRREDRPQVLPIQNLEDARRRSSSTTARSRRPPASASSTATRRRPREPDPLGGAVRRLRQRRPGDHRQLHRLRRGEVGPDQPADPAAPARLRGLRPRALQRPDRALPGARRRGQHPARLPDHRRPVLPPAPPPGADPQAAAAGRLHPEGPAAPQPRGREASRS